LQVQLTIIRLFYISAIAEDQQVVAFEEVLDAWEYGTTEEILLAGFLLKDMRELVDTRKRDYGG